MKNKYFKSTSKLGYFVLLISLFLGSAAADAQVRVNFTQRTSQYTPDKKIYNVKGDFTMIGNTNMTLQSYGDETANSNNQMVYVDIDNNANTLNSSSANLTLSTENGAVPSCSNIIYAGLYWTGRSSDDTSSPNTFTITKNGVTKNYDKHVVYLKGPTASGYTTITAANSDIYYPTTSDGFMYSAYAEVTDYVKNNGLGTYTVADIALREGNGGSTGYYGGWSLIVVYENSKMKYRDVTIFDGHAYVAGNTTTNFEIPVSGFNTVQAGPVNMKLGLMAGEGDRGISGDYFNIRNAADNAWVTLSHSGNTGTNFFNSSILTGGNTRNPNLLNNTGLDISMFNISNPSNTVIANNQTSTKFRYGTTQDTYVIFAVAMSVDAYIPDVEATISALTVGGVPATTPPQAVLPGQDVEYKIQIKNKGTEPINNYKITVPVPYNATYVANSATKTVYLGTPSPNNLYFDPTVGSNGSIIWDYGTLPLPSNPDTLIAELTFKLKATTDCTLLKNANCNNIVAVDGVMSGTGAITGVGFTKKNLIVGFSGSGTCQGTAVAAPLLININAVNYVNQNCQGTPPITAFTFCSPGNTIPITSVNGSFPAGSLFYNQFPVGPGTTQYTINNPFPGTNGTSTYYAVPPNSVAGCYFQFTITVTTISSQPTAADVAYCQGATAVPLTATPSNPNYTLYYYTSLNGVPQLSITPSTATAGQTTYYVAQGQSAQCIGPKKPIVVTVYPQPTINAPANATLQGCGTSAITGLAYSTTPVTITLAQLTAAGGSIPNSGNIGPFTITYVDVLSGTCPRVVTRTFSLNSTCAPVTAVQTITIQDTTPPVIAALPAPSTISCPATPSFAQATATDNCGGTVTLTSNDVTTPGACAGSRTIVRTWTATDACGNVATASQTITVQDTTAPVIAQLPAPTTISCPATPSFAQATATDACGSSFTLNFNDVTTPGACANARTVTRTWTATDACGNTSTASQVINVVDTVAPVISALPAPSTVSCSAGAPVFATPTATDGCGGTVTLTSSDNTVPGQCAGSYTTTRTWTATDVCGNVATASQTITVQDTTASVIAQLPAPTTISCPATPSFAQATATDACGSSFTLNFNDVTTPGACANARTVTRTWTATDACGNTSTASQVINVVDTVAPVISALPAPSTVSCSAGSPVFATPTATDGCGGTVTLTSSDNTVPGQCAGSYTTTRTWTATDVCGNVATASQTITVQDTTAPVIAQLPAPTTISCPATPSFAQATATDACGSSFTLNFNDVTTPGACANARTVTRTWTATDACGNTSTASQVINVVDTVAPVISALPAPSTVSCSAGAPVFATPTATDGCGGTVTLTSSDNTVPGQCAGSYTTTRTWTATDVCGNVATASQTITVQDTTAPVIAQLPAPTTISCPATPSFAQATATDACGSSFTLNFNDVTTPGACAGSYTTVRTWTATDSCGNTSTASQSITVTDTTAPVIAQLPAPTTISCPATPSFATATATDACGSAFTLTFNDVTTNGTCAGSYTTVRTWTATDSCGNTSTASQSITVTDTTAPVISQLPAPTTINCPATPSFATATATDACGSAFTLNFNDVTTPGSCANNYTVTRTWTATDACGNTSTASQSITVQDVTPPTITTPASNIVVECDGSGSTTALQAWLANNGGAVASDTCSAVTWSNNFSSLAADCSAAVTVVFTATDVCGNFATTTATFSVQDTTIPVAPQAPAAFSGSCAADVPANVTLTAVDNCSGNISVQGVDSTVAGACPNSFVTTRTWTFTDACNNSTSVSQIITINDTVAPVAPQAPANVTVSCAADVPSMISLTAVDNCQGNISVQGVDSTVPGACPNSFVTTRTWTFVDACNNSSSVSQTITVNDDIAPVAPQAPASITVACAAEVPAMISLTATDNCSGNITVEGVDSIAQGTCANRYVITRTWTFADACNNTTVLTQTITVNDDVAPVIAQLPAATTISCPATPEFAQAVATDNCAGTVALTFNDVTTNGNCAGSYSVTRTWTATDVCGNTTTASQTINVEDTTAPVIAQLPAASTIDCPALPIFAQATATDECGSAFTLTFEDVTTPGQCPSAYSVTRTWTATDACGNSSTASQTINVQDITPPAIATAAQNITVECDGSGSVGAITEWLNNHAGAQAVDTCSEVVWTNNFSTLSADCSTAVTVIFTATDACGNFATTSATFTVQDTTAPVAPEAPATTNVICASDVPTNPTLTATDNCAGTIDASGVDVITPGACPNSFTIVRTWTFTDACNNSSSVSQTINVNDNIAPVAPEAPANVTVSCTGEVPVAASLSATDNCGEVIVAEAVDSIAAGSCANNYVITRTWTFTDACGNSSSASQTINVNDTIAPVIAELPAATTISCPAIPEFAQATATDNCEGAVSLTFEDVTTNGQCAGSYSVTRTWTATDVCGNTATAVQTINVEDTTAPVIAELPAPSTIDCPAIPEFAQATATDSCGSDFTLTFEDVTTPGQCEGSYSVTRTWTATDACGNSSTATQTINVQDVTSPEITTVAQNITVECDGNAQDEIAVWLASNAGAVASDSCSNVTWTNNFGALNNDCSTAVTVIFTATDACGNAATTSATFTVVDTTAPVAPEAPATANVACSGDVPANITLTATDNCAGEISVEGVDAVTPGSCANSFTIVRTWTFTDACNNTSTVSQTINVNDDIAPVAPEAPASVTVTCADEVPAMVSLTATDNCSGEITVDGVDAIASGDCPNSFVVTRTWTFVDACGNQSSVSQTINVNDTVAPVAPAAPADVTVACASEVPAMVSLTATDNCDDQITVEGNDITIPGQCANSYTIARTWTFVDACGNQSSVTQNITVNDTIAPTAPEAPADITVSCSGEVPAMISLTAIDNCGQQAITVEGVDSTVSGACPNSFVVTRTWTFVDSCGNQSSVSQTITVEDNIAPVIPGNVPVDITMDCAGDIPAAIQLTASDNCGEQITADAVDSTVAGNCANQFVVTRTWTFVDACGNSSVATQIITVNDNVAPTFNEAAPADISVSCDAIPAAATLTATDNCIGGATVTMNETTNAGQCAGTYTLVRTWTATDICGNTATATQSISVIDITSPTFDQPIPGKISVSCDAVPAAPVITATDTCGTATVAMTEATTPGDCPGSYTLIRTWTATDLCGNQTTGSQVINVSDLAGPTVNEAFEANVNVSCDAIPSAPVLTFSDNCSGVGQVTFTENIVNQQPGSYTIVREWSVADGCGNPTVVSQTVNVTITNAEIVVPTESCTLAIESIDLNQFIPAGIPTGGVWVDESNTGGLNGSLWTPTDIPLGHYNIRYDVAVDPTCPRTLKIDMEVNADCNPEGCRSIIVHNAFSPNGDGLNEFFSIENLEQFECFPTNKVEIYNRWGILVYETRQYDNAGNSFKGVSEGRVTVDKASELPTGTYFYILEYQDARLQGDVKTVKKDGYLYLSR